MTQLSLKQMLPELNQAQWALLELEISERVIGYYEPTATIEEFRKLTSKEQDADLQTCARNVLRADQLQALKDLIGGTA